MTNKYSKSTHYWLIYTREVDWCLTLSSSAKPIVTRIYFFSLQTLLKYDDSRFHSQNAPYRHGMHYFTLFDNRINTNIFCYSKLLHSIFAGFFFPLQTATLFSWGPENPRVECESHARDSEQKRAYAPTNQRQLNERTLLLFERPAIAAISNSNSNSIGVRVFVYQQIHGNVFGISSPCRLRRVVDIIAAV